MYNLPIHFKRLFLFILLVTFPLATIESTLNAPLTHLNLTDGIFFYNIEKIVEKLLKMEGKGSVKKYIESALDVKEEIERHFNTTIDLDAYLHNVEKEVKKQGQHFNKGQ
jgi:hypothetical protein